jgi:hypothetical protein
VPLREWTLNNLRARIAYGTPLFVYSCEGADKRLRRESIYELKDLSRRADN